MTNKFEELPLFKEAHPLVLAIYKLTNRFPPDEKFGLTSQLRRWMRLLQIQNVQR